MSRRSAALVVVVLVLAVALLLCRRPQQHVAPEMRGKSGEAVVVVPPSDITRAASSAVHRATAQSESHRDPASSITAYETGIQELAPLRPVLLGPISVKNGDSFSVTVAAQPSVPVSAYSFVVRFDPSHLQAVTATVNDFTKQSDPSKLMESANAGDGAFLIGAEQEFGGEGDALSSFAVIRFQSVASGETLVQLERMQVIGTDGHYIVSAAPDPLTLSVND